MTRVTVQKGLDYITPYLERRRWAAIVGNFPLQLVTLLPILDFHFSANIIYMQKFIITVEPNIDLAMKLMN